MPNRQSRVRLTPSEARDRFLERAAEWWDDFNTWYRSHPEASFDEIEAELGRQRRAVVGELAELGLRQGDLGASPEAPMCQQCGQPMEFKGYLIKEVHGLEAEAEIPRAYYYCSTCGVGFFPPGATPSTERR